jgi:signal transduction histidine kinase
MSLPSVRNGIEHDPLYNLVTTALEQKELSGLLGLLKLLCEELDAYGCTIWEVGGVARLDLRSPQSRVFVLAQWFREGSSIAGYDMPINRSVSGWAVLHNETANIPNMDEDTRVFDPMLKDIRLRSMCAVPVSLGDGKGSLSFYRKELSPFTTEEVAWMEKAASLLPRLFHAIRNRASQRLIQWVSDKLDDSEIKSPNEVLASDEMQKLLHKICFRVAETFQCIETSIFMKPTARESSSFLLQATTWPKWSTFKKKAYEAKASEGLTGWVLERRKPIKIFSLGDFVRDEKIIKRVYPGVVWRDSLEIKASARKILKLGPDDGLQPLSFMAVPILRGPRVLGVIRCCAAKKAPYYFAEREVNLLELIAAQLSRFWSNWIIRRAVRDENRMWQALIHYVGEWNDAVQKLIDQNVPDEKVIFAAALKKVATFIKEAEILDVRLFDEHTKALSFAVVHGKAWEDGTEAEIKERLEKQFPVPDDLVRFPLGLRAFQENKTQGVLNAEVDGYKSKTFPQTKQIVAAPISVLNKKMGVLDIRNTSETPFPQNIFDVAELLGKQLGLYSSLIFAVREARKAEEKIKDQDKIRRQTAQDLAHQLKGPIQQLHTRIQSLVNQSSWGSADKRLLVIRGLIRKSERVARSTSAFAELAEQGSLEFKAADFRRLTFDALVKLLKEACADNYILLEAYRQIRFEVDENSFSVLRTVHVDVVEYLVEQAINSLLDNAGKYSYPETKIKVFGGITKAGRFHISVVNTGYVIKASEVQLCVQREWRGDDARLVTGEGSGIGLWFVDHVMKAHKGEVLITPRNDQIQTQVSLIFPVKK